MQRFCWQISIGLLMNSQHENIKMFWSMDLQGVLWLKHDHLFGVISIGGGGGGVYMRPCRRQGSSIEVAKKFTVNLCRGFQFRYRDQNFYVEFKNNLANSVYVAMLLYKFPFHSHKMYVFLVSWNANWTVNQSPPHPPGHRKLGIFYGSALNVKWK